MDFKNLSANDVSEMVKTNARAPAITIYMPTHRHGSPPHMSEDEIRLKNLVAKAESILDNRDDSRYFKGEFRERVESLISRKGGTFWEHQSEGLLILARPGSFMLFHLPLETEEYIAVDDQYHLAPILGLLNDLIEYYVVVVSQRAPALLAGDMYGLKPTKLQLPPTIEMALNIDETGRDTEQQSSAFGAKGYNGRGGDRSPDDDERLRFWRLLDRRILKFADKKKPLILAGINSEVNEYRSVSRYPNILRSHIEGSYGGLKPQTLYQKTLDVVRKQLLNPRHNMVLNEYRRLKGQVPNRVADDAAEIADAADKGRVDKLLLSVIRYTTDTVRDSVKSAPIITQPPLQSAQLINKIAREVYSAGGKVSNIEAGHMPNSRSLMLAIMRY